MSDPELIVKPVPSVDDGKRSCVECTHPLPLTEEFYHRDPYAPDGFCPMCKSCRRRYRQDKRSPKIQKELSRVKFEMMKKAINNGAGAVVPSNEQMAQYLMETPTCGDARNIVHQLEEDYQNAAPGSLMRVKLMQLKLAILQKAADQRPAIALDQLSDAQLEAALKLALNTVGALEDHAESGETGPAVD